MTLSKKLIALMDRLRKFLCASATYTYKYSHEETYVNGKRVPVTPKAKQRFDLAFRKADEGFKKMDEAFGEFDKGFKEL